MAMCRSPECRSRIVCAPEYMLLSTALLFSQKEVVYFKPHFLWDRRIHPQFTREPVSGLIGLQHTKL